MSTDRHPSPYRDNALKNFRCYHFFGFATLAQYREWVFKKQWRENLHKQGVLLNVYSIDKELYRRGEYQCIFQKDEATLVDTMSPSYRDA